MKIAFGKGSYKGKDNTEFDGLTIEVKSHKTEEHDGVTITGYFFEYNGKEYIALSRNDQDEVSVCGYDNYSRAKNRYFKRDQFQVID